MWSDDPVADFERHDAEQERELSKLPRCYECRHRIQSEECYDIGGNLICPGCLDKHYKVWTENFIDE